MMLCYLQASEVIFGLHCYSHTNQHLSAPLPSVTVCPAGGKRQTLQIRWNIMGNIMRQPAAVMARGFWLIELLPMLHTEQDMHMADKSVGTLYFSS